MIKTIKSLKTWCEELPALLADGEMHVGIHIPEETEVATGGWEADVDRDWCGEHGVPVYDQDRNGGTSIYAPGSLVCGMIYSHDDYPEWVVGRLGEDFAAYLRGKGLSVDYQGNDVLVDGYKVASGCGYNLPPDFRRCYEGFQISVNQDMEVIRHACKKPMVKVPKALSDYGITTEEVRDWVYAWFRAYLGEEIT